MLKNKILIVTLLKDLRVTDKETVKIVENVLSNDINKKIVNDIKLSGGKAESFSGNKNQFN